MLSAAPDRTNSLDVICLFLSFISREQQFKPAVQEEIYKIFSQASRLVANPKDIDDDLLPGSIDLALQLKSHPDFQNILGAVTNSNAINSEMARQLLEVMKPTGQYCRS